MGRYDEAYSVVLANGDELQLVRLMGRTGPILDKLSAETVSSLFSTIIQFVQGNKFLDQSFRWIRASIDTSTPLPPTLYNDLAQVLSNASAAPTRFGAQAAQMQALLNTQAA
eukprot:TRINITY_DN37416_c0_g1_i1.p3 TRINITY_DN37416_c0_g1~~TRINITY_DN37416_c0_g1_i1.p3  ORF type:complete len:128 (-),score=16.38 TRINITY_DN37416_c0_g1_i1:375-710(-)